jgi:hypothetical protein
MHLVANGSLVLALSCSFGSRLIAQTPAELWRDIDANSRMAYVIGIVDGISVAEMESTRLFTDTLTRRMWLKESPNARVPIDSGFALLLRPYRVGSTDAVVNGITRLYEDPANACLYWRIAARASMKRLTGSSPSDVEAELTGFRAVLASSCKPR